MVHSRELESKDKLVLTCPNCGKLSQHEWRTWDDFPSAPVVCPHCYDFYWVRKATEEIVKIQVAHSQVPVKIPEIPEGVSVYIDNKEHKFHLERGIIIERDHCFYKVKFKSHDKKLDGIKTWIPEHWVKEIPEVLQ